MLSPISRLKEMLCFEETRHYYSASESFPTSAGMRTPNLSIRLETLYIIFRFEIGTVLFHLLILKPSCCQTFVSYLLTRGTLKGSLGFIQIEIEIIIVSLEELRSKYTVENDNLHLLLCWDSPQEDLPPYLLISTIAVVTIKNQVLVLLKNMSIKYSWERKQQFSQNR